MTEYFLNKPNIKIPLWMMTVPYQSQVIPKGSAYNIKEEGANCQVFAYTLLRYNNRVVPDLRSSELWADRAYSKLVGDNYEPLDILFFHKKKEAYGAHLGVYIGDNQVIHNAKHIGLPVVWNINQFQKERRYQFLLGGKRFGLLSE